MLKQNFSKTFSIKTFLFWFLSMTLLLNFSCNTTEPTDELKPGRRDYTWTVDTLNIPFTVLTRIWGSSPSDVWAIGPGGDLDKTIYHFDGVSWSNDGISRPLSPTAIFGTSPSNVWIGGRGGDIWNYDGSNWTKNTTITIPDYNLVGFENIWGDSPNNIYAVGYAQDGITYRSVLVKYDGVNWKNINIYKIRNSFIKIRAGSKTSKDSFVLGIRFEQLFEDTSLVYRFDGDSFIEIYTGITSKDELGEFENINNEILFLRGSELYKYEYNDKLKLIYKINNSNFSNAIWGRNSIDIFLRMTNGIAHFNGTDVQYLYNFDNGILINGAIVFNSTIFFLAYDFNNSLNLIIRGKLD
ncbi:MAG: hypothetical protein WAU11_05865 [Ignavibacteriaceae bacterium]